MYSQVAAAASQDAGVSQAAGVSENPVQLGASPGAATLVVVVDVGAGDPTLAQTPCMAGGQSQGADGDGVCG